MKNLHLWCNDGQIARLISSLGGCKLATNEVRRLLVLLLRIADDPTARQEIDNIGTQLAVSGMATRPNPHQADDEADSALALDMRDDSVRLGMRLNHCDVTVEVGTEKVKVEQVAATVQEWKYVRPPYLVTFDFHKDSSFQAGKILSRYAYSMYRGHWVCEVDGERMSVLEALSTLCREVVLSPGFELYAPLQMEEEKSGA
jgi:hypothetical protein